ncbi:MAG TPA: hypothetical protein VMV10_10210 [Pirellulales bacterium]|nr:hypothetical protein [Pirellulales bacterium]
MANFDVLSGRLLLDTGEFVRGLQQASAAAQLFSQRLGVSMQQARRDIEQLNASQLKLSVAARSLPRPGGASPWAALFAGPAAAFNSPTGTTSQAALMGFVLQVNNGLAKQAELADQLGDAVERARAALEESSAGGEIEDKIKEAAKKVSEAIEKAIDKANEAVDKFKEALAALADKSEETTDKVKELAEKVKDLGEKSEEADEKVEKLGEAAEKLGEKAKKAGEKLEKLAEKVKELFGGAFGIGGGGQGGAGNPNVSTTTPGMSPQQKARAKKAQKIVDKQQAHEQDLRNRGTILGNRLEKWGKQFETWTPKRQNTAKAAYAKWTKTRGHAQIKAVRAAVQGMAGSPEERAQLQRVQQQMVEKYRLGQQLAERAKHTSDAAEARKLMQLSSMIVRSADAMATSFNNSAKAGDNAATTTRKATEVEKDSTKVTESAEKAMKDLGKAAKEAAAQGKGQLTPQQQQMQQQAQQFQQQVQNWWNQQFQQAGQQAMQQAGQQAWDSGQAMLEQAIGGPAQVQAMIDQAAATGHMKDAIRLIRQRLEAQLAQSKINLHGLATGLDPNAGSFGAMPGVDNTTYLMTQDIPLVRLIKYLQAQLAALPKMAAGGIVTGPTSIVAGEAGPEAVLPLNNFWNMMGSLPVFQDIRSAMESIGTWFSEGGNNPALAAKYFANLDQVQHVYEYSLDALRNSRSVNFTPASMLGGPPAGGGAAGAIGMEGRAAYGPGGPPFGAGGYAGPMFPIGAMHLNFHGVDITAPGAAAQFAQQLLPALDAEARRAGYSMMGGSMLRAGYGNSANRAFGYAR